MTSQVLWTLGLVAILVATQAAVRALMHRGRGDAPLGVDRERRRFWMKQLGRLAAFAVLVAGLIAIWANDAARFASIAGIVTAGIAVALQRMILSFAGYFVILRGKAFTVGDRITIGGVRGDVLALGFMQTTVMEMGEPPTAKSGEPVVWINARQYTGRLVRVTNDKIFDTPVYNYTREFQYLWEEMHFPIEYGADYSRAESILLDVSRRHTKEVVDAATPALARLQARYFVPGSMTLEPRVFIRLTDNWIELSLRFIVPVHDVRGIKDAMTREVLAAFSAASLNIASTTYAITGLPTVRVEASISPPSASPTNHAGSPSG